MEKYTLTLIKEHTHKGKKYFIGDEITVSKPDADFLLNHQVINKIPARSNKLSEGK